MPKENKYAHLGAEIDENYRDPNTQNVLKKNKYTHLGAEIDEENLGTGVLDRAAQLGGGMVKGAGAMVDTAESAGHAVGKAFLKYHDDQYDSWDPFEGEQSEQQKVTYEKPQHESFEKQWSSAYEEKAAEYGLTAYKDDTFGRFLDTTGQFLLPMPGTTIRTLVTGALGASALRTFIDPQSFWGTVACDVLGGHMASGLSKMFSPKNIQEFAKNVMNDFAEHGLVEAINGASAHGMGKLFAKYSTINEAMLHIVKDLQQKPEFVAIVNNRILDFFNNFVDQTFFGSDKLRAAKQVKAKDAAKLAGSLNNPVKQTSSELGQTVAHKVEDNIAMASDKYGKSLNELFVTYDADGKYINKFLKESETFSLENTKKFVDHELKGWKYPPKNPATSQYLEFLEQTKSMIENHKKGVIPQDMRKTIESVNAMIPLEGKYIGLKESIIKDLEKSPNKKFVKEYKKINKDYENFAGVYKKPETRAILRDIEKGGSETFKTSASFKNADRVIHSLPDSSLKDTWTSIKQNYVNDATKDFVKDGVIKIPKMEEVFISGSKESMEVMQSIIGKDNFERMSKVTEYMHARSEGLKRMKNPSGSAVTYANLKGVATIAGALFSGQKVIAAGLIGGVVGGKYITRLMSNERFTTALLHYADPAYKAVSKPELKKVLFAMAKQAAKSVTTQGTEE